MTFKKAQGMSITTIIIAALTLIVLVVLIAILTGKISVFSSGSADASEGALSSVCNTNHDGIRGHCQRDGEDSCVQSFGSGPWTDCGPGVACCSG